MKPIKFLTIIALVFYHSPSYSQVKTLWTKSFQENIQWQKVTSMGHYIAGTSNNLLGINPETGEVIWRVSQFADIPADQVLQVGSSPLISINTGDDVYMIDPYSGKIKFNSKGAGIAFIKDQFVLYKANGILVSGRNSNNKDILLMSSLETGEVMWKIEEDYGRLVTANELSEKELLIVTIFFNYKVDPTTGEIIWKNDVSAETNKQLEKLGAFGNLVKQAASNVAQDIDFKVEFYRHPTQEIFYIASENENKSSMGQTETITYSTSYIAFSLKDGSSIWDSQLEVDGKIGPVYFHDNGLVVLPDNGMTTKINKFDYNTTEGQWGKKGNGIKVKGGIYSYLKVGNGLILVSQNSSGKNFISYLDLEQGLLTFDKPVKVDGEVVYSENTSSGLLYFTTEEINILDKTTGSVKFKDPMVTNPSLIGVKDNALFAYDVKDKIIKKLDKSSGAISALSGELKFDGKESPVSLEIRDNGILLSSSQNLALVDYNGKTIFQSYFEAPREAGIIRALQYAQAVRAAYIGAAAYTASAAFQSAGQQVKTDDPVAGAVAQGIGQAYGELGNAATDFAKKSFQQASARFKATKEANDYVVVLAKLSSGNALVKVNKNTGKMEAEINLGKEKEPDYVMDGVTGQVFLRKDISSITGYQL